MADLLKKYIKSPEKLCLYLAFLVALTAMLGSLFFSEILAFPPCVLCWYQRIAMYPLVSIFAVGILRKDKNVDLYAWPLIIIGSIIGTYHNLLYYNILSEALAPCITGISCTTKFIQWLGFVTIPFLSLTAFLILGMIMVIYRKLNFK